MFGIQENRAAPAHLIQKAKSEIQNIMSSARGVHFIMVCSTDGFELTSIYKKENVNTVIQFAVLRALTFQESKEGYKKIQELLEYDLPISDDEYEITSLFRYFEDDLGLEKSEINEFMKGFDLYKNWKV